MMGRSAHHLIMEAGMRYKVTLHEADGPREIALEADGMVQAILEARARNPRRVPYDVLESETGRIVSGKPLPDGS